jgi:hypothetical protein
MKGILKGVIENDFPCLLMNLILVLAFYKWKKSFNLFLKHLMIDQESV